MKERLRRNVVPDAEGGGVWGWGFVLAWVARRIKCC
jgi:hypothetical protein